MPSITLPPEIITPADALRQERIHPGAYLVALERAVSFVQQCNQRDIQEFVESLIVLGAQQADLWHEVVRAIDGPVRPDKRSINANYHTLVQETQALLSKNIKACWK